MFESKINRGRANGYAPLDSSGKVSVSNLPSFATSASLTDLSTSVDSRLDTLEEFSSSADDRYVLSGSITQTNWDNIENKPNDIISSSTQILDLGFVTGSYTTINTFNSLTQSFNSISQSFNVISGSVGTVDFNGLISGSSQLTSSFDARYTLSGSVQPLPSNLVSSSAQITAFGFISSSVTIPAGTISGSSQLTSSFDGRYVLESETGSLQTSITNLNTFTASQSTASLVTSISNLNSFTQSFSTSVDSRFDTLEGTIISGSPNYTQVLGNKRTGITSVGTSIISGSITTTGNPVQIMVTGDANPIGGSGWARLQIFRDGNGIGNIIQVENSSNLNVPYCLNVIDTPSAGTYTYSMRTVDSMSGTFDFGEHNGPVLTAIELRTNTNLPSTNNVFTGTNRFNGQVTLGGVGGDEGGELQLVTAQTNTTLTGSYASVDIYRDRLRIFEGGGTFRGVHIDLSKAPGGVAGELIWKTSGFVNAGTFLTLDNLKVSVTTDGNRGLSVGAVSTNFTANIAGWYGLVGGGSGNSANNIGYGTTGSTSAFSWNFPTEGNTSQYNILDKTNSRFYRVTLMIGAGYNNNFISIERLF